jgi:prevent-host-death family protein
MPISEASDHISERVGRARYGGEATILTHYGAPAAVVISFEEYQRLTHAHEESGCYDLPPEIMAQVEESRRHPERGTPGRAGLPAPAAMAEVRFGPAALLAYDGSEPASIKRRLRNLPGCLVCRAPCGSRWGCR